MRNYEILQKTIFKDFFSFAISSRDYCCEVRDIDEEQLLNGNMFMLCNGSGILCCGFEAFFADG